MIGSIKSALFESLIDCLREFLCRMKKLFPKVSILVFIFFIAILNSCRTAAPVTPEETEEPSEEIVTQSKDKEKIIVEIEAQKIPSDTIPDTVVIEKIDSDVPRAMREFRAAWIASVANINWPSRSGLSSEEQQLEAIALLDLLQEKNFNAVILQIRPQADALYQSDLEPWSYFLTGEQGKAPEPFYDPLQFWIKAAHDRGLELHAWLNPYRAQHSTGGEISEQSIIKTNPESVVKLKNGMYWMDPAKESVQEHATAVIMDVVKRYDIDGIHLDDYFYPYASYNGGEEFPDEKSWAAYQVGEGALSRDDWRRENVNLFIQELYNEIKAVKPFVKFGISPFGIWRPGYPESIAGFDQYSELYADARLWLNQGWIDYFMPQLYWGINEIQQSFPVLLGWWKAENDQKRHLWPGINAALGKDEVISQIMITRGMLTESPGVAFWSIGPLVKKDTLATVIEEGPYRKEALVPASPWLNNKAPVAPIVVPTVAEEMLKLSWVSGGDEKVFRWVVYYNYGSFWNYKILDHHEEFVKFQRSINGKPLVSIGVTAVDRTGNESEFKEIKIVTDRLKKK